ncbi:heparan-alpha-glucosaminide N-acetyltransferase domain-containing protein [Kineococcus sp. SYSU DK005]|uniref:heparan-alpha-glucosaminide N-acetyltransferase domain-containing protein n=1 Tax=Kineococcus sp. SYSU DK005 TaxID=3383126 RepID=UPI003D7CA226
MATPSPAPSPGAPASPPPATARDAARVVGVDLARAVAIAGMVAVHVLPEGSTGLPGALYDLADGRASGLFGVLAGVSLGLSTRRTPPGPRPRAAARVGVAVRGVLVALLGLALVSAGSRIAIVLPYYGAAFLLVLPVLWWPARRLAVLAAAWLVAGPVAGWWLRGALALAPTYEQPTLLDLAHPLELLRTLLLTGYYPVLGWTAYLLLGLAAARAGLAGAAALRLLGAGLVLAAGSWVLSALLLGPAGGLARLAQLGAVPGAPSWTFHGTAPTASPWFLAVAEPHSGTPLDLLHTSGTALAVLGAALLLPAALTRFLLPVAAFGSMPLSAYTAHVLALAAHPGDAPSLLAAHVLLGLLLATGWRLAFGRGPLESALSGAAGAAAALVAPRPARG